jgi:2-dehydro-3-deoxyphosphooctonate aldolase (KDO 8-P synthase)
VGVKNFLIGKGHPLTIISGPCVIENESHTLSCAEKLKEITSKLRVNFIFKACYDKANRSSVNSFRGPGIEEGLRILQRVKSEFDLPVVSDIHMPDEAPIAAEVCDLLQIPAFLCRQTDLIIAAAKTGKPLHIKKGQFLAPWDMANVIEKAVACGNHKIILADRGTCFGYNNLVSDMRSIPLMQRYGYPVCYDATHSVQLPGGRGDSSGGDRDLMPALARAAIAAGADLLFIESHPDPQQAKSDSAVVYPLDKLSELLTVLVDIYECIRK